MERVTLVDAQPCHNEPHYEVIMGGEFDAVELVPVRDVNTGAEVAFAAYYIANGEQWVDPTPVDDEEDGA